MGKRNERRRNGMITAWLVCVVMLVSSVAYAQDAESILDNTASAYEGSGGISASFTMNTYSETQHTGESFEGTVQMRGDKFVLKTPDMVTWYDGKTQWTYVRRSEEVNVTTPTGDELRFTNPGLLIRSYKKDFTATYIGESTSSNGKMADDVELIPKKKGNIVKVTLQIERYTSVPTRITVTAKNGMSTTVHVSEVVTGLYQSDDLFVFKEADYPNAEVIDLR